MQISYGPPGARGVTQLMAVGDVDFSENLTDHLVTKATYASAAFAVLGIVVGSRQIRDLGLGGALALFAVRTASRGRKTVEVTQPAPVPAPAGWYR